MFGTSFRISAANSSTGGGGDGGHRTHRQRSSGQSGAPRQGLFGNPLHGPTWGRLLQLPGTGDLQIRSEQVHTYLTPLHYHWDGGPGRTGEGRGSPERERTGLDDGFFSHVVHGNCWQLRRARLAKTGCQVSRITRGWILLNRTRDPAASYWAQMVWGCFGLSLICWAPVSHRCMVCGPCRGPSPPRS